MNNRQESKTEALREDNARRRCPPWSAIMIWTQTGWRTHQVEFGCPRGCKMRRVPSRCTSFAVQTNSRIGKLASDRCRRMTLRAGEWESIVQLLVWELVRRCTGKWCKAAHHGGRRQGLAGCLAAPVHRRTGSPLSRKGPSQMLQERDGLGTESVMLSTHSVSMNRRILRWGSNG
jgi:hypothetical protein